MKTHHILILCVAWALAGCTAALQDECRIHGEMADHSRDGKKIYLVPLTRPDSVGVDSTVIVDGKFEFATRKRMMAIVRVELLSRFGLEDLLVVTEPGDLSVRIGEVSSGAGTPQNDSLQQWKDYTRRHNQRLRAYLDIMDKAYRAGDTLALNEARNIADSLRRGYRHYSRQLAERVGEGLLRDFLQERFPTSYKRKHPDGTVEEIPLD